MSKYKREINIEKFEFKSGEKIPLSIAFETYGELNRSKNNAVLVCHPLTHSSHVADHGEDDEKGWWRNMVGPSRYIDTKDHFVVCVNVPGSCYGTTGPSSIDPKTEEPYGTDFPELFITDMVKAQKLVIDHLDINKLKSVIGGSIGGQQVLEWSKRYPSRLKSIIPIATGARVSPMMLGFGYISQNAIRSDPNWSGGKYYRQNRVPEYGLKIARQIGHLTYLSREGIEKKFGRERSEQEKKREFEIESYLEYQGEKFVERFDPNSYIYLTEAMHQFDLSEGYSSDFRAVKDYEGLVYLISIHSDWHFTVEESEYLAEVYEKTNNLVMHDVIESSYGHDAFLVETEKLGPKLRLFLKYMSEENFDSNLN